MSPLPCCGRRPKTLVTLCCGRHWTFLADRWVRVLTPSTIFRYRERT